MMGVIIGDIVGSIYEWHNIKTKTFPFFQPHCRFTDDTVMTLATAQALMAGGTAQAFTQAYQTFGLRYPYAGYGKSFRLWIQSDNPQPYGSYGNGSAMRVAPCAWISDSLDETLRLAALSASVTHNHPQGIKGAVETARAIWLLRHCNGDIAQGKAQIIAQSHYAFTKSLDEIRPTYRFDVSCQGSVPQAIQAFLESTDFEDAIRNAISLGGDSDTIAAITGSLAQAAYGVPPWMAEQAITYLDEHLLQVYHTWSALIASRD